MGLILASASPRRQELLQWIAPSFTICPADIDEHLPCTIPPSDTARILAEKKAQAVASQHPTDIIIGSDTVVILENTIYGKPRDAADAERMLRALSGKTHWVITGVALVQGKKMISFDTKTAVQFYPLTTQQIQAYVQTGEPLDKAGAYGIQGKGALLVERIEGDFYGVIGLPIAPLAKALAAFSAESKEEINIE